MDEGAAVTPSPVLGNEAANVTRWVQFAFIAAAAVLFWLFDKLVTGMIERVGIWFDMPEVPPTAVTLISAVLAVTVAYLGYRNLKVQEFSHEVMGELSKVKWPGREETWSNTVVVIITSVIAAVILFAFDYAWSAITDLIYRT